MHFRLFNFILIAINSLVIINAKNLEFRIDHASNQFLKDGEPFRYVAGDFSYFRVPAILWEDRLIKLRAAGLNAVQTYVEWSFHETERGVYDFTGDKDLVKFIETAQQVGLLVILRPGPYICAEREMGGLPYWLLSVNPNMRLRTSDPTYLAEVDRWFSLLLPKLVPFLYQNGGPIIMVQVENEYGSYYACDYVYYTFLRDLMIYFLGEEVVLFTTDGGADYFLQCGKLDKVYATIDFGSSNNKSSAVVNVKETFLVQKRHEKYGPHVNSEFYTGWLDHWEEKHSKVDAQSVASTLDVILAMNASVSLFTFLGGTSFGFTAGANENERYTPDPTSYDYDAPLNEAGDVTDKYFAIRNVIGKYFPLPNITTPTASPKMQTSPIPMTPIKNIFDPSFMRNPVTSTQPITFESLKLGYGWVLYSTIIPFRPSDPSLLRVNGLADRAQVFVDGRYQGTLSRTRKIYEMPIDALIDQRLDIFVENQGRVGYGNNLNDTKGIRENVMLGNIELTNWKQYKYFSSWDQVIQTIEKEYETNNNTVDQLSKNRIPTFFSGQFTLTNDGKQPLDSFLRLDGWGKGVAFLNGFNLGKYWPSAGPQITLYAPKHLFKAFPQTNVITIFELERSPSSPSSISSDCLNSTSKCSVQFVRTSDIDGATPQDYLN